MNPVRTVAVSVSAGLVMLLPGASRAQDTDECRAAARAIEVPDVAVADDPCLLLANALLTQSSLLQSAALLITQPDAIDPGTVFSQRQLQQANPSPASMAGSLAQSEAIPGVSPTALASGSIAMVGSEAGDDALVALGLNPAVLFFINEASEALARYSRFMDLSVFLPVTETSTGTNDDGLDYFGLRLRMNWFGVAAGDQLWDESAVLIRDWMARTGQALAKTLELLGDAPNMTACAIALDGGADEAAVTSACGRPLDLGIDADQANAVARELGEALARVRRDLDADYFGADIRLDWGDPTLGAVPGASGTSLFAGVGYGRRILGDPASDTSAGLELRAGGRHTSVDVDSRGRFAFEGGLGLELTRSLDLQEISAGVGVELRYGRGGASLTEEQAQMNWTVFRSSLVVPITDANSLSIAVGLPIDGDVSSYLSVNFNWALLLPAGDVP